MIQSVKPISYLRNNLLFVTLLFLLAFIPLYPKIPLFDVLPGYIVRVRVEDFLIVFAGLIWFIHALKHRQTWKNGYFGLIGIYGLVGAISIILGVFLLKTIPFELLHIGKSALHFFRYLEYFALFFIAFSGVTKKSHARIVLFVVAATTLLVTLYGFGQKYLRFPLYSTMNREYSKGQAFVLEAGGKVSSTFGGHYDLAAFLVIVLPLIFSFALHEFGRSKKQLIIFFGLQFTHLAGAWLLFETGSKTALISYFVGLILVLFLHVRRVADKKLKRVLVGATALGLLVFLVAFLTLFGTATKDRFVNLYQSVFQAQTNASPTDLVGSGYELKTFNQTSPDGEVTTTQKLEKSTWSPNALKYGISMGIRLDTLWPQAIRGLANNPLFGSGYGTLSKLENTQFVEADSTDNNYLRTLGETGFLGLLTFYGFVLMSMGLVYKKLKQQTGILVALSIGYLGASLGLLINAVYIDVFAASKVAFSFWGITGLTLSLVARDEGTAKFWQVLRHIMRHKTLYASIVITFFLLQQNPLASRSNLNAFTSSTQAFENFVAARCFVEHHSFSLCRDSGLALTPHISLYSVLLVPFLSLSQNPAMYYYLNLLLVFVVLFLLYKVFRVRSFFSLLLFIFLAFEYGFSEGPLEDGKILRLFLLVPFALLLVQKYLMESKHARVARGVLIAAILFIPITEPQFGSKFLESFRNDEPVVRRDAVLQADGNVGSDAVLLSLDTPYYIDLYSTKDYSVLPASSAQVYMDRPAQVWGEYDFSNLTALYSKLLSEGKQLFLSDYNLGSAKPYIDDFALLRKNFDVRYRTIDCFDACSLFSVAQKSEKISPIPMALSAQTLNPLELPDAYSFAFVGNSQENNDLYTFAKKIEPLKALPLKFLVVSGQIFTPNDGGAAQAASLLFADTNYPMLYNSDHVGSERFFTKRDYFLTLSLASDSSATNETRLFAFNALLEMEQLEGIKNLFIISHNLDWQNTDDQKNFIHQLREKLLGFPNLHVYILTADHAPSEPKTLSDGYTTYQAISDLSETDAEYSTVSVDEKGGVELKQTVLP